MTRRRQTLTYDACENLMVVKDRFAPSGFRLNTTGKSIKLQNNTRLFKMEHEHTHEPYYVVQLWNTAVVTICKNGQYILNSGGWQTVITKDRINSYSPASLIQKKQVWYIITYSNTNTNKVLFYDGIVVDSEGNVVDKPNVLSKIERVAAKLKSKIERVAANTRTN